MKRSDPRPWIVEVAALACCWLGSVVLAMPAITLYGWWMARLLPNVEPQAWEARLVRDLVLLTTTGLGLFAFGLAVRYLFIPSVEEGGGEGPGSSGS